MNGFRFDIIPDVGRCWLSRSLAIRFVRSDALELTNVGNMSNNHSVAARFAAPQQQAHIHFRVAAHAPYVDQYQMHVRDTSSTCTVPIYFRLWCCCDVLCIFGRYVPVVLFHCSVSGAERQTSDWRAAMPSARLRESPATERKETTQTLPSIIINFVRVCWCAALERI